MRINTRFSLLLTGILALAAPLLAQDKPLPDGLLASQISVPIETTTVNIVPFTAAVQANSLIVRTQAQNGGKNYITPIRCTLTDGDYSIEKSMEPVDWRLNCPETDYELPLGELRTLSASTTLKLDFAEWAKPELSVYAVLPAILRKDDLSKGLDFETPESTGLWLCHEKGSVSINSSYAKNGQYCLFADWQVKN